ncbi:MAG: hypothetical protein ABIC68_06415 [Candidatus Omnitrophota bacterium]
MMKLMLSLKNIINANFQGQKFYRSKQILKKIFLFMLAVCLGGVLSSCEPTYPARALIPQLTLKIKEETKLDATCRIAGKTLWVFIPCENLIDEEKVSWSTKGLEEMSKVIAVAHRVALSTDAKIDFLAVTAADVKKYGLELTAIEYLPDIKEAMFEKVSRGEYFMRSVRNVDFNEKAVGDLKGTYKRFYDIAFDEFIGYQIIHRTKTLFAKDKELKNIFEIRSSASSVKFGIIKVDFEFMRKKYDLDNHEKSINPLEYAKMIAAEIIKNYSYHDFQAIEITDTFSGDSIKLLENDISQIVIKLPNYLD